MQTTTVGSLTAIQTLADTSLVTVIIGRINHLDESDFRPLLEQLGLVGLQVSSRDWDYLEHDDLIIWTLVSDPHAKVVP